MPPSSKLNLRRRHLLGIEDLSPADIVQLLDEAQRFKAVVGRSESLDTLRGRTVVNLFFENSTRTRMSFEMAAKRLGAYVVNFDVSTSSFRKGETLLDSIQTIAALGADYIVMRHASSGAARFISPHFDAAVINAGDGEHEHPTQALLDVFTIREALGRVEGLKVAIVGDILHSRVARSLIWCLKKLGAEVVVVGPSTLCPVQFQAFGVRVSNDFESGISGADVIYILRIQLERQRVGRFPSLAEYRRMYGLDEERLHAAKANVLVMHPGPVNRGVEITDEVMRRRNSLVVQQVENGVPVRMAVLSLLDPSFSEAR
ncbi:MAG: aspartate carbamoyltransferase catalytic subunit [Phycisphaeraceae bacterium]|nr:MAG: aspartate carbamoyltransferase catalytic subunit [Phycisphaeraceae bacterium]